jgi:hypothetical protein
VVTRPLEGEAPTIDLVIGDNMANASPILKLFFSRVDELIAGISKKPGEPVGRNEGNPKDAETPLNDLTGL